MSAYDGGAGGAWSGGGPPSQQQFPTTDPWTGAPTAYPPYNYDYGQYTAASAYPAAPGYNYDPRYYQAAPVSSTYYPNYVPPPPGDFYPLTKETSPSRSPHSRNYERRTDYKSPSRSVSPYRRDREYSKRDSSYDKDHKRTSRSTSRRRKYSSSSSASRSRSRSHNSDKAKIKSKRVGSSDSYKSEKSYKVSSKKSYKTAPLPRSSSRQRHQRARSRRSKSKNKIVKAGSSSKKYKLSKYKSSSSSPDRARSKTPSKPKSHSKSRDYSVTPPKSFKTHKSRSPKKRRKSVSLTPPGAYKLRESSLTPPKSYNRARSASSSRTPSPPSIGKRKHSLRSRSSSGSTTPPGRSASRSDKSEGTPPRRRSKPRRRTKSRSYSKSDSERTPPKRKEKSKTRRKSRDRSLASSPPRSNDGSGSDDQRRGQFTVADRKRFWKMHRSRIEEKGKKTPSIEKKPPPGALENTTADDVEYGVPPEVEGPNFAELIPPPDKAHELEQAALLKPKPIPIKNDGSFLETFKKMQEQIKPPPEPKPEIKKPALPFIGKRRGGRVLKTGLVKKAKAIDEQPADSAPKDAWSLYMQEVKKYRETSCEEERKTRPLVK